MEKVIKNMNMINRLKWLSLLFGGFMCFFLEPWLGETWAVVIGTAAGIAFLFLCESGKRGVLSDHVIQDLEEALSAKGWKESIFEVKSLKPGLIIRIYLIKAGEKALMCNRIIMEKVESSWYKEMVWMTQLVSVNSKDEVDNVRNTLDDELIENLKSMRDNKK